MNKQELEKALSSYTKHAPLFHEGMATTAVCTQIFMRLFGLIPNAISVNKHNYDIIQKSLTSKAPWEAKEKLDEEQMNFVEHNHLEADISVINFYNKHKDEAILIINRTDYIVIADNLILWSSVRYADITIFTMETQIPKVVQDELVYHALPKEYNINYLSVASYGMLPIPLKVELINIDLQKNYNDDLPHKAICDFINDDKSGLCLLHGTAGTGKTTYIKHLVTNTDKTIYYMDATILSGVTDAKFIEFLADSKNSIILIEDCEELLKQRTDGNSRLSALLNLSDGILGDAFKFKFICTFNADISKIDEALLRKGRTQVFYEFKPLAVEKCNLILMERGIDDVVDKPMTLAELYNYEVTNLKSEIKTQKIGF